jgi:hypothetical protein
VSLDAGDDGTQAMYYGVDSGPTTVQRVTAMPQQCLHCHKQYASRAKLLQHQRKAHPDIAPPPQIRHPKQVRHKWLVMWSRVNHHQLGQAEVKLVARMLFTSPM